MLILLSPSKGQDFDCPVPAGALTVPDLLDRSAVLINVLKKMPVPRLRQLMAISENLAVLNADRYRHFSLPFTPQNARPALFAFKGDVYSRIPVETYDADDLAHAQAHLRILSGLYGVLRPLDLIQPYRLEMKTRLKTAAGGNLYRFWGDTLTANLNAALKKMPSKVLVNLASSEYIKAVRPRKVRGRLLTVHFREIKNGQARVIAIFAKRARGMMAHFLLKNRITAPEGIKTFTTDGYRFSPDASDDNNWVFTRPQPA